MGLDLGKSWRLIRDEFQERQYNCFESGQNMRLRVKMKNIQFLLNATTKPTQHFEHNVFIISLHNKSHNYYSTPLKCIHVATLIWAFIIQHTHTHIIICIISIIIILSEYG